jgi:hypothetical protein
MRLLTDEAGQRAKRANRKKSDAGLRKHEVPAYVLRDKKTGALVSFPVSESKKVRQQLEREHGLSGKAARKLMKTLRREREKTEPKVFELPPRPIPPHTPGGVA